MYAIKKKYYYYYYSKISITKPFLKSKIAQITTITFYLCKIVLQ